MILCVVAATRGPVIAYRLVYVLLAYVGQPSSGLAILPDSPYSRDCHFFLVTASVRFVVLALAVFFCMCPH